MSPLPAVSVIIPTYKHRDFIVETLHSVFAQTFTDYEVIVVNDGSPDDTAAVLAPFVASGAIRYLEQANAGQAAARNRGLAEATGEFIAFLDDDDLWPPDKLQWQVELLRSTDYPMVGGIAGYIEGTTRLDVRDAAGDFELSAESFFLGGNHFTSPGQTLIRRSALDAVGGFDPSIWGVDDLDLFIRLAAVHPLFHSGRCALYYRRHASNASHAVERMFTNCVAVLKKNLSLLPAESRRRAIRLGCRWVYDYAGRRLMDASLRGPKRDLSVAARVVAVMWRPAMRDPFLARRLIIDLLPRTLRKALLFMWGGVRSKRAANAV